MREKINNRQPPRSSIFLSAKRELPKWVFLLAAANFLWPRMPEAQELRRHGVSLPVSVAAQYSRVFSTNKPILTKTAFNSAGDNGGGVSVAKYALIGAAIGGAIGAAFVTSRRCTQYKDPLSGTCSSVRTSITVGALLGGVPGALIGALAALSSKSDD